MPMSHPIALRNYIPHLYKKIKRAGVGTHEHTFLQPCQMHIDEQENLEHPQMHIDEQTELSNQM